jgi:hypothetical protein
MNIIAGFALPDMSLRNSVPPRVTANRASWSSVCETVQVPSVMASW